VVEARPGAGGAVGTEAAARSAPDGYTLFMANNSTHGSNPALYPKLPYDAVNDFAPISMVASVPYVLVVEPALAGELGAGADRAREVEAGRINYASAGQRQHAPVLRPSCSSRPPASTSCTSRTRARPPGITALLAGEVSLMFANLTDIGAQIRSGKVKPLAVTTLKRAELLPNVPTMVEAGVPDFEITSWFGLLRPAGTPRRSWRG
jgi:tripartite-type tricarboxylate transporter receptor subunit TctC